MEKLKEITKKIACLFLIYTLGIFLGLFFCLLKKIGTVQLLGKENLIFKDKNQGLLILCNHPSLLEPILIPLLFFKHYLLRPLSGYPISTPDKANYLDKWYWAWLNLCAIPINRKDKRSAIRSLSKMKEVLGSGKTLILFPEGGRTSSGGEILHSKKGKKIRTLKGGVGRLISETNPIVQFIWVDGAEEVLPNSKNKNKLYHTYPRIWEKVIIKIGKPVSFCKHLDREAILQEVAVMMLNLADQKE